MATSVEFGPAARSEFDEAFDWYARRSHGAAIAFASEVDTAIEKIAADPERFAGTHAGCRYCAIPRFPYCVIYHHTRSKIVVVAIAHAKRRPGYWRPRLI
jgi:plasmid stabilization system protein ParE